MLDVVIYIILGILGLAALAFVGFVLYLICTQGLGILIGIGVVAVPIYFGIVCIDNNRK